MPEFPTTDLCAVFTFPADFLWHFVLESVKGKATPARADWSEAIGKRKGRSLNMWVIPIFISWGRCLYFLPCSPKSIYKAVSIWAWLNVETLKNLSDLIPLPSPYSNAIFNISSLSWSVNFRRRASLRAFCNSLNPWTLILEVPTINLRLPSMLVSATQITAGQPQLSFILKGLNASSPWAPSILCGSLTILTSSSIEAAASISENLPKMNDAWFLTNRLRSLPFDYYQ